MFRKKVQKQAPVIIAYVKSMKHTNPSIDIVIENQFIPVVFACDYCMQLIVENLFYSCVNWQCWVVKVMKIINWSLWSDS